MGLFDFLIRKKVATKKVATKIEVPPDQSGKEQIFEPRPEAEEYKKSIVTIPNRIGDCIRVYYYPKAKFTPVSSAERMALAMQDSGDWKVDLRENDSQISVYYHGELFGELAEKCDIAKDWIQRNDPMFCLLGNLGDSGNYLTLAFYRDEQKRLSSRQSNIVKLIRCTNEDAQLNMSGLKEGDKLELEEDYDREDAVNVLVDGCEIGALPKKQALKFLEDGCAGVFLDHMGSDDNCNDIPFVKIYW